MMFHLVDIAFQWHCKPSEFGVCEPDEDAAVMAAYSRTVGRMKAVEYEEQESARAKLKGRRKRG